ncbi:hypothetical protein ANAPH2_01476 [Anaplasma phagocytophilum]|nr:hypothetical protein ANAPH2_01476 [Anaplasma phagocytophilum]
MPIGMGLALLLQVLFVRLFGVVLAVPLCYYPVVAVFLVHFQWSSFLQRLNAAVL